MRYAWIPAVNAAEAAAGVDVSAGVGAAVAVGSVVAPCRVRGGGQ